MRKCFRGVAAAAALACSLTSCDTPAKNAGAPVPEAKQAVAADIKELYMAASAAAPQSLAQQKLILQMARQASNGEEVLLVMRAAVGVFPANGSAQEQESENQVRSLAAGKMMELGTLDQLIEYATQYPINPESTRPFLQRMFQLGSEKSDPRTWYRIRAAAFRLKVGDLERQAQARGDQLAGKQ